MQSTYILRLLTGRKIANYHRLDDWIDFALDVLLIQLLLNLNLLLFVVHYDLLKTFI